MANAVPSRFGQNNSAGDAKALFLKVFAGEVLTKFAETNVALGRHYVRTISSGHSAQFPMSWHGDAYYHTPGAEIVGTDVPFSEQTITIDDMLVAPRFLADIDEALSHFEVRSIYSTDVANALARAFDKNVLQVGVLAARADNPITAAPGGSQVKDADALTNGAKLAADILDAARIMDEKDIPVEGRNVFVRPAEYYRLLKEAKDYIDTDLNPEGNGSLASGKFNRIGGMPIIMTNNLPRTNINTGLTKYQGDFTGTAALVMHPMAVGTVKLIDLAVDVQWDLRRLGTLLVARYAVGHGILRPDCAVEITTDVS